MFKQSGRGTSRRGTCPQLLRGKACEYKVTDCWYDKHPKELMRQVFCTNRECTGEGCHYDHSHRFCEKDHKEDHKEGGECPFSHDAGKTPCPVLYGGGCCDSDECPFSHVCPELVRGRVCYFDANHVDGDCCEFRHPFDVLESIECDRMKRGESCGESCYYDHSNAQRYPCKYGNSCRVGRSCPLKHDNYPCIACKKRRCKKAEHDLCRDCNRKATAESRLRAKVKKAQEEDPEPEKEAKEDEEESEDESESEDDDGLAGLVAAFAQ